ncbi:MAG: hypothetical protein JRJ87_19680 [Deltaproteobacteria bacterium]|nr:hypothetical protein [Deltaproteobacteria bacterium]
MGTRARQFIILMSVFMAVLAAGCSEDDEKTLYIAFAAAPTDNCKVSVQKSEPYDYLSYGTLDLGHPYFDNEPVYYLYPQIHNYVVSEFDNIRVDPAGDFLQIEKAIVTFEWLSGREVLEASPDLAPLLSMETDFELKTYPNIIIFLPKEAGDPDQIVTIVRLITPDVGNMLTGLQNQTPENLSKLILGAHLRFEGHTFDGREIVSNDFVFPIEFCWGCLDVACRDENNNLIGYPACRPGQDSNPLGCEN